ncbi:MAG: FHA domain-containing protein [Bacteroidaceae bacterium]|nr:FHA domain-containing protein [Bacteroidaceae bacterium]
MEITIGRDSKTRCLSIKRGDKVTTAGQPGSVPLDVSRQHVELRLQPDGRWQLRNLNEQNVTFVNGMAVESKMVTENDRIELGESRYLLDWETIKGPKVEEIDLRPIKQAWDNYTQANLDIRNRQKTTNLLASVPMAFSMLGGLLVGVVPEIRTLALVFTGIALVIMLYGFYRRLTDRSIEETEEVKKRLQQEYTCPKCGRFLGFQDFDILKQNKACPYCKTKFKEEKAVS